MRKALELLRREPRARVFFAVFAQSSLGTGAAYVALLLVAYERVGSPWAISVVLLADLLPAMALGPVFGAAADRWSRKTCAIAADVVRAAAFAGVALVSGFEATVAFALLAGAGTGLFKPASLAALPSLVRERRLPAATALYGAIDDFGLAVGPAVAAGVLVVGSAETILLLNAVTFAVSALILVPLRFGDVPARDSAATARPSLLSEAREGLRVIPKVKGLGPVLLASATALVFSGLVNVAELPFVTGELGATDVQFSVLVALAGVGFVSGSLAGSAGGSLEVIKRRYLLGLLVMGLGFLACGLAPAYAIALWTFAAAGFGNAFMLVYERLFVQATVPDALTARVFGAKDALTAWAFGLAFTAAGALVAAFDARTTMIVAGAGGCLVCLVATAALSRGRRRGERRAEEASEEARLPRGAGHELRMPGGARQHGANAIADRDHWLRLLEDLAEGGHDRGVELGSRVRQ
jgi:MFS family permease